MVTRLAKLMNAFGAWMLHMSERMRPGAGRYAVIPQGQYDCLPKGTCVFGAADRFLLVPKNRYRAVLLPEQQISGDKGIGWITEDNSAESYDVLWGDSENLAMFREEAGGVREKLSREIGDAVAEHLLPGCSVVDIGCGVGDLLQEVRARQSDVQVAGLDFSERAVEVAKKTFADGAFQQYAIERELPYPSASFDIVMCTDVLEHLEYPRDVAAELVRICRPGGSVFIVVPDGRVDQFLGHYWFWDEVSLGGLLENWRARVMTLPETGELLAKIRVPEPPGEL